VFINLHLKYSSRRCGGICHPSSRLSRDFGDVEEKAWLYAGAVILNANLTYIKR